MSHIEERDKSTKKNKKKRGSDKDQEKPPGTQCSGAAAMQ